MSRSVSPVSRAELLEYPRMIKFRLGLSVVHASATLFNRTYPHVLHASIVPRPWYGVVRWLIDRLPCSWRRHLQAWFPGAFLPPRVVVKQLLRTDKGAAQLFDNEIRAYGRLQQVQGTAIPRFFGEGVCEGQRALVLSVVDGPTALEQQQPMPVEEFQQKMETAHAHLEAGYMVYSDLKLDNVILAEDGRFVLIDLEFVVEPEDRPELRYRNAVLGFVDRYKHFLKIWADEQAERDRWEQVARGGRHGFPPRAR
ncbi:Protein kinase-like domain protein [Niveomyces insectorum RCEF 264]|uniref:Protein kinase-like domain protein n=1 Tax=Niveomyces insectorum RCEF 264 TaxID=1081102 RepID=A0A167W344_9HYPO|nr:Protein kinase-like domain protein [Niveomyces insectorum RCEF 264]